MYENVLDQVDGFRYCVLSGLDDSHGTSVDMCKNESDVVKMLAENVMAEIEWTLDDIQESEPERYEYLLGARDTIKNDLDSCDMHDMISMWDRTLSNGWWVIVIELSNGEVVAYRRQSGGRTIVG
jgi:hypothetical protein